MPREFSSDEIKNIVVQINMSFKSLKQKGREIPLIQKNLKKEFADFEERFPKLFLMACSNDFDPKKFSWLISMKSQIDSGQKNANETSILVGKELAKEYIYSKLDMTKEPTIDY